MKIAGVTLPVYHIDSTTQTSTKNTTRFLHISTEIKPEDALAWHNDPASKPSIKMCTARFANHLLPANADNFKWMPSAMRYSSIAS